MVSNGVPSAFGFRVRGPQTLRFTRRGGGVEALEISVAPRPRQRPAGAPLAEWLLAAPDGETRGALYQVDRGFEFWATDAGGYAIDPAAGWIEIPDHADEIVREQRLWGVPSALCFMYREDVPLHAAAVEVDGGAVLLAAPRRHGKTTLALAFHRHGYRVLSEDLTCCRPATVPTVLPGPALLRIRPDVYDGVPPSGTHLVASRPDRVYLAIDDDRKGSSAPVPIVAIVFLREASGTIALTPLAPGAALPDLWSLSFRVATDDARGRTFQQLARLAGALPIWNLYRPLRLDCLDATVEEIVRMCHA